MVIYNTHFLRAKTCLELFMGLEQALHALHRIRGNSQLQEGHMTPVERLNSVRFARKCLPFHLKIKN